MRVGMIGIGGIADVYRKGLVQYTQPIAAVCDINESRVAEVAAATGAKGYTDYRAMLANEQLDAVFVSIPPGVHGNQVIDVVNSGAAVFVAKPIGLDLELVRQTHAAIVASGVINQVGYMARYADIAAKARELIGDRKIGAGALYGTDADQPPVVGQAIDLWWPDYRTEHAHVRFVALFDGRGGAGAELWPSRRR